MVYAQGALDLVRHFVNNPGHSPEDGPFFPTFIVLLVVDVEPNIQCCSLWWIIIDLFLQEAINIRIIDSDYEGVLGLRFVVDLHFLEGVKAGQSKGKWEKWCTRVVSLFGGNDMLANLEFGKLCVLVEKHRRTGVFASSQKAELRNSKSKGKEL